MIEVVIGNSHAQVREVPPEIFKAISDVLSYEVQGSTFARQAMPFWDGMARMMNAKGIFPTGLLQRLEDFLVKNSIPFTKLDTRVKPTTKQKIALSVPFPPRYYQTDAGVIAASRPRGVFLMGTGAGKTLTSALVIDEHKVQTLFVTPDTGLRNQVFNDFECWFPGQVGKGIDSGKPIVVANIQSLTNKNPKLFERFEQLIVDEFHHAAAKSYKKINKYCRNAFYRYGFTGTFTRPDGSEMDMHGVLADVIFTKPTSELIEEGFLVRPDITIVRFELSKKRLRMPYKDAYDKITQDHDFAMLVSGIARESIDAGKQTLVLVRRIEHGKLLEGLIPGAVFVSGEMPNEEREHLKKQFLQKKIGGLIATNVFGEGQDIPSIDVLVNARCQKTEIQTAQGIGRALRLSPGKERAEVFDFLVMGHKNLEDHSVERIRTYKRERAFRITVKRP